jgi:lipopolysaccharide/colanic/teichoic acid biosynthesis glycosyltransferase
MDAVYLRNRSTGLDLWILAQTPLVLLGRKIRLPAYVRTAIEEPTDA